MPSPLTNIKSNSRSPLMKLKAAAFAKNSDALKKKKVKKSGSKDPGPSKKTKKDKKSKKSKKGIKSNESIENDQHGSKKSTRPSRPPPGLENFIDDYVSEESDSDDDSSSSDENDCDAYLTDSEILDPKGLKALYTGGKNVVVKGSSNVKNQKMSKGKTGTVTTSSPKMISKTSMAQVNNRSPIPLSSLPVSGLIIPRKASVPSIPMTNTMSLSNSSNQVQLTLPKPGSINLKPLQGIWCYPGNMNTLIIVQLNGGKDKAQVVFHQAGISTTPAKPPTPEPLKILPSPKKMIRLGFRQWVADLSIDSLKGSCSADIRWYSLNNSSLDGATSKATTWCRVKDVKSVISRIEGEQKRAISEGKRLLEVMKVVKKVGGK